MDENPGVLETQPFDISGLKEQKALENHRMAIFMLTQMDRKLPTYASDKNWIDLVDHVFRLQQMREDNAQQESLTYIKDCIRTSKENHIEDLQRLYIIQGEEFREEQMDRYISKGDLTKRSAPDPASASFRKQEVCHPITSFIGQLNNPLSLRHFMLKPVNLTATLLDGTMIQSGFAVLTFPAYCISRNNNVAFGLERKRSGNSRTPAFLYL